MSLPATVQNQEDNPTADYSYRRASGFTGYEILETNKDGMCSVVMTVRPGEYFLERDEFKAFKQDKGIRRFIELYIDTLNETKQTGYSPRTQTIRLEEQVEDSMISNGWDRQTTMDGETYDVPNLNEPTWPEGQEDAYDDLLEQIDDLWSYSHLDVPNRSNPESKIVIQKKINDDYQAPLAAFHVLTDNRNTTVRKFELSLSKAIICFNHALDRFCVQETMIAADTLAKLPFTAFSPSEKVTPVNEDSTRRQRPRRQRRFDRRC